MITAKIASIGRLFVAKSRITSWLICSNQDVMVFILFSQYNCGIVNRLYVGNKYCKSVRWCRGRLGQAIGARHVRELPQISRSRKIIKLEATGVEEPQTAKAAEDNGVAATSGTPFRGAGRNQGQDRRGSARPAGQRRQYKREITNPFNNIQPGQLLEGKVVRKPCKILLFSSTSAQPALIDMASSPIYCSTTVQGAHWWSLTFVCLMQVLQI